MARASSVALFNLHKINPEMLPPILGDYCEPLNLYTICPLDSVHRKPAIVSACSKSLLAWEEEHAKRIEPEIKQLKSEKQTIESVIEGRRQKALRARDMTAIKQLQSEINKFEANTPKTQNLPFIF